jgi:signal transduction histidine kinase
LRQSEKLSALGLLAAEVAHEIRNPLTVMKLLYHSLNLQFESSDPRSKDAKIIESKMDHLNKIVEQILAFARSTEPEMSPVNLNELISELRLLVRHKLSNQDIKMMIDLEPALPLVSGNVPQLEQAFLNLILNAVESMPDGGTLGITTKPIVDKNRKKRVLIEFKDSGKGMTKEQKQKAFKAVLATTKAKGTGIGLAITGRIIEAHRGQIKINSRINRGTRIQIDFPTSE